MKTNVSVLNRVVLLLNALILVVNFLLTFTSTNRQGEMAAVASRSSGGRVVQGQNPSTDFLRLVGSLEGVLPPATIDSLTPEQLQAVNDALEHYRRVVDAGVTTVIYSQAGPVPARQRLAEVNKDARDEVERTLRSAIKDDIIVGQLTTAVVRFG